MRWYYTHYLPQLKVVPLNSALEHLHIAYHNLQTYADIYLYSLSSSFAPPSSPTVAHQQRDGHLPHSHIKSFRHNRLRRRDEFCMDGPPSLSSSWSGALTYQLIHGADRWLDEMSYHCTYTFPSLSLLLSLSLSHCMRVCVCVWNRVDFALGWWRISWVAGEY